MTRDLRRTLNINFVSPDSSPITTLTREPHRMLAGQAGQRYRLIAIVLLRALVALVTFSAKSRSRFRETAVTLVTMARNTH